MFNIRGVLKAAEQPSSQGSDLGERRPHGNMQGGGGGVNERR